jgi:hypothetical protein
MAKMQTLIGLLREKYAEYRSGDISDTEDQALDTFTEWCEEYLSQHNQPVNVVYPYKGIGLRLQGGENVCFCDQEDMESVKSTSVPIMRAPRGFGGQLQDSKAVPIT